MHAPRHTEDEQGDLFQPASRTLWVGKSRCVSGFADQQSFDNSTSNEAYPPRSGPLRSLGYVE